MGRAQNFTTASSKPSGIWLKNLLTITVRCAPPDVPTEVIDKLIQLESRGRALTYILRPNI